MSNAGGHTHRCFECREYWQHRSGECHSFMERWCGCGVRWPPSNISEDILLGGADVAGRAVRYWDSAVTARPCVNVSNYSDDDESGEEARREAYDAAIGEEWSR